MNFRRLFLGSSLLAVMALPLVANADQMYLKVTGQAQGVLKSGNIQKGHEDQIKVVEMSNSIVSPRDPQSGLPTGQRMHKPLVLLLELDAATPLLFNALAKNENLKTVELTLFRPKTMVGMGAQGAGIEAPEMTITLTNANLATFAFKTVDKGGPEARTATGASSVMLEVSFTYQKIEIDMGKGGTKGMDDWEKRV